MPMAVKLMLMHVPLQILSSTVMQSHKTGRVQTSDRVLHTCCISLLAVGPRAPTTTLSRNCANERVFPRGVDHSGCPRGEKESCLHDPVFCYPCGLTKPVLGRSSDVSLLTI